MKKVVIALIALTAASAFAGMTCRNNWDGSVSCSHTDGYSTTTRRNWDDSTTTTDTYGNSSTCRRNWDNTVTCN